MANFSEVLIHWYIENKRNLPWRNTKDPYCIWLSEIILQQTRVEQGLPYYQKFLNEHPTVQSLARASENDILRLWQGLGYYTRARNLHDTAKYVSDELSGLFPKTFNELIKLKGVGTYTAAAIASFCFNEKVAVVDGNVFRFLSRLYNINTPINTSQGQKLFSSLANELISDESPGLFNQALMEFGSLCCRPTSPNCESCPFILECESYKNHTIMKRPVKLRSKKKKELYYIYFFPLKNKKVLLRKIDTKTIYQNMYEFPKKEFWDKNDFLNELNNLKKHQNSKLISHELSHIKIKAVFVDSIIEDSNPKNILINKEEMDNYPLPRLITKYLDSINPR